MQRAWTDAGKGFGRGPRQGRRESRIALTPLARPLGVWFAALGLSAIPFQALREDQPTPAALAQAWLAQALHQRAEGAGPAQAQPGWTTTGLPAALPQGATTAARTPAVPSSTMPAPVAAATVKPVPAAVAGGPLDAVASLLDPRSLGPEPQPLGQGLPLGPSFQGPVAAPIVTAGRAEEPLVVATIEPEVAIPVPEDRPSMLEIPEPVPRPFSLQSTPAPERPRLAQPLPTRRTREALAAVPPRDDRGFFEKLFGVQKSPGAAMAYAVPQDDVIDAARGKRLNPTPAVASAGTAVYDISAKVVYMPNGDKLEAHSGLGDRRDDPRSVHISMKGPTPPHLYDLTLREQLFHGVRALRLNPVGGSEAIHNRVGLLAHTFMLGPNGDSNGCVSFRDYDRFLQAYLRGDVKRLLVVASMN